MYIKSSIIIGKRVFPETRGNKKLTLFCLYLLVQWTSGNIREEKALKAIKLAK